MKKRKILKIISASVLVSALVITVAAVYDSSEDPLVSLSYLKDVFKKELLAEVDEKIENSVKKDTDTENNPFEFEENEDNATKESSSESFTYEVIELKNGDSLYAISACDIMLRAGQASCIAPDANQGIADYTSGEEIYNAQSLTKNHMCLIPRGDGRGVKAQSESVFIMIRGGYTIVEG